ncbi:chemotaxis protein CheW [Thalassotalea insulae]|uniref:Chemotaxis protein CheW n=1 Tax=Thalassotalea insulae TaxID=2056778 RepID=A0ABQ6GQW4_9GAMM|nr:chemotaxis protein CheW [Thalassotalea insulae]GLX76825.1 chemotaxis protein CheW [Thalassotalea insulae]
MSDEQEYLTFKIKDEEFGLDILYVQEIRVWSSVTELPNKPNYFKGIINLRGVIIPVIDLRQRFEIEPLEYSATTVTIILRSQKSERLNAIGIVVDSVSDVYKVSSEAIRPAPEFGSHIDSCFLNGIASIDEKLIILLDTQKLLDQNELYSATSKEELAEIVD